MPPTLVRKRDNQSKDYCKQATQHSDFATTERGNLKTHTKVYQERILQSTYDKLLGCD